jgi:dihydroflavonol-4-reductase
MNHWTLVTGASGFVGSRLVRELIARGERVKGFVRAGSNLKPLEGLPRDRFQLAFGDILVEHTLYRALASCHRMYHVAANFTMWDSQPDRIVAPAVDGTRAALEAARKRRLEKVVVTSSTATLGVSSTAEPMDESHAFNLPDAEAYVRAKYEAERVALELAERVPVVVVLPSSIVGPGDWKPTPSGALVTRYLKLPPTTRVPIMDGGLNFVDVEDVVRGHMLAMKQGQSGERYILGGDNLTFEQLFDTLSELTGLAPAGRKYAAAFLSMIGRVLELKARLFGGQPLISHRMARDYTGKFVFVTSAKAERELGYSHRPAREALARAVQWFLQQGYVPARAARRVRLELRAA